jgi:hypothetical protein
MTFGDLQRLRENSRMAIIAAQGEGEVRELGWPLR